MKNGFPIILNIFVGRLLPKDVDTASYMTKATQLTVRFLEAKQVLSHEVIYSMRSEATQYICQRSFLPPFYGIAPQQQSVFEVYPAGSKQKKEIIVLFRFTDGAIVHAV